MPAQLVALTDGASILLDKPILLVGRHPECDIQIDSRKVSRRHCCIALVNDYLVVRDLDSTNGIRINGERVLEGRLNAGDELAIGNFRYRVCGEDGSDMPNTSTPVVSQAEDELLESSEQPIALPEPGKPDSSRQPPREAVRPAPGPPVLGADDPYIIPEHLELMPRSGSYPELSKQPPPA